MRSKFEETIANQLIDMDAKFKYELNTYEHFVSVQGGRCSVCNSNKILKICRYTPDFFLPNGVIIEAKGNFKATTRRRIAQFVKSYPKLDLRMVFMRNNKISKNSKTRYTDWCDSHGISCAVGEVPIEWAK